MIRRWLASLADLFRRADGRPAWAVVVAFALVNGLVLVNAVLHDPRVTYDAAGHRSYSKVLATGRLPTAADTHEFFSPPLPYVPVAIARYVLRADATDGRAGVDAALKVGQLVQVGYALVLTLSVLAIARRARPGDAFCAAAALLCLGMMPVFYRSFAMVRGEPLLATLTTLGTLLTFRTYADPTRGRAPTLAGGAAVGLALGAACLSRQWAFFVLPGLGLIGLWRLIVDAPARRATLLAGCATIVVAVLVASPFYLYLQVKYGSVRTFNRTANTLNARDALIRADAAATNPAAAISADDADDAPPPARSSKPIERTSLGTAIERLVTRPTRDAFADRRGLLFYADAWGDYWQYFLVSASDKRGRHVDAGKIGGFAAQKGYRSNYATMPAYLGRVCVASIVPTLALLGGLGASLVALRRVPRTVDAARGLVVPAIGLLILGSIAGYAWFVASYLGERGDTVKATYLLQICPLLAIACAAWLATLRDRWPRVAWSIVGALLVVLIHNAPACVTHTVQAW